MSSKCFLCPNNSPKPKCSHLRSWNKQMFVMLALENRLSEWLAANFLVVLIDCLLQSCMWAWSNAAETTVCNFPPNFHPAIKRLYGNNFMPHTQSVIRSYIYLTLFCMQRSESQAQSFTSQQISHKRCSRWTLESGPRRSGMWFSDFVKCTRGSAGASWNPDKAVTWEVV